MEFNMGSALGKIGCKDIKGGMRTLSSSRSCCMIKCFGLKEMFYFRTVQYNSLYDY